MSVGDERTPTDQLRRLWLDGVTVSQIGRSLGISPASVCRRAQRLGLPKRSRTLQQADRAAVSELYEDGLTIAEIGRRTGFHRDTVRSALVHAGVTLRGPWRKWPVRHDAFSDPVSPEAWYWIGMLAADGCVRGSGISLVQKCSSEPVLRRFLAFLGCPERPLYSTNKGNGWVAHVSSRRLAADLAPHGVVPRKSLTLRPSAASVAQPLFWLGVFDGDGCISFTGRGAPLVTMLGTKLLMDAFAAFAESNLTGKRPVVGAERPDKDTLWTVRVQGDRARQLAVLWLAASEVSLEAKRERLERAARYESRHTHARLAVRRRRCDWCGAWVERMPSQLRSHVFCCRSHYWSWRTAR